MPRVFESRRARQYAGLAEWFNATALKAVECNSSRSSNLRAGAKDTDSNQILKQILE